jgi:apolipoprotein N-acyltransferase
MPINKLIAEPSNHQTVIIRGLMVWIMFMFAEVLHGTARVLWLEPLIGDVKARQISVFTGLAIILAIVIVSIRWIGATRMTQLYEIGLLWLGLTVSFEIMLGRFVTGLSWERIASDYNLLHGGLMPIGLLVLTVSPLIATWIRGSLTESSEN